MKTICTPELRIVELKAKDILSSGAGEPTSPTTSPDIVMDEIEDE